MESERSAHSFQFSHVFGEQSDQAEIFESVGRPAVAKCFQGVNSTVFAYGQTGSGKTFSISGSESWDSRGLIPRALSYIFDEIESKKEEKIQLLVSYLEVYNENVYDLLDKQNLELPFEKWSRVQLREDETGATHLRNLSAHRCRSEQQGVDLLLMGNFMRHTASTGLNLTSSRSHSIFSVSFDIRQPGGSRLESKLNFVDLAGSERVAKSALEGKLLKEAKHINLSLTYLEQVILALSQRQKAPGKTAHVPFRNSVLTSLLRDSLGGNSLTSMIACLAMTDYSRDETISTMRFAKRCATIKTVAV